MKVYCFFSAHYLPHLGGVERYTYNIAKKLVDRGNRVIVVTSEMEGEPDRSTQEGIEIIRTETVSTMNDRLPFYINSKKNKEIFAYLEEQAIDYIIVNTKFYFLSVVATKFAKRNGIKCIVIEHGTGHIDFSNPIVKKIGEFYEHFLTRLVYMNCSNFAGVSNECGGWLEHFGIKAIGTIYNAIDFDDIQSIIHEEKNNHDWNTIAYSGRIMREKGVCNLIEAFSCIRERYPKLKLLIIGDGRELKELKAKYGRDEAIIFTGKVSFKDVIRYLSKAGIYCFPSSYPEGLPTCVIEAMAAGVYTVSSAAGGAKEVIIDDNYGKLIRDCSVASLTKELDTVLKLTVSERETIAENGKKRVQEHFSWKKTVDELNRLLEEI